MIAESIEATDLEQRFITSLTDEQKADYFELEKATAAEDARRRELFLCRVASHFPGFAPAILAVGGAHLMEQSTEVGGTCCGLMTLAQTLAPLVQQLSGAG